jgi:hypothetical protein
MDNKQTENVKVQFELKTLFQDKKVEKFIDGKKKNTVQIQYDIIEGNNGFFIPRLSEREISPESVMTISIEQPVSIGLFRTYNFKVWNENEIQGLTITSPNNKGLNSNISDLVKDEFEKQFMNEQNGEKQSGNQIIFQVYYQKKHVMKKIDEHDSEEEEVKFYIKLEKRDKKPKNSVGVSSPFCLEYIVMSKEKSNVDISSASKVKTAIEKMEGWANFHFQNEQSSCFSPNLLFDQYAFMWLLKRMIHLSLFN